MQTPAGQPMPKFKPTEHFDAHAARIKSVEPVKGSKGKSRVTFQDGFYTPAEIDTKSLDNAAKAEDGDYFVVINGQSSIMPAADFEQAWKPV